VNRSRPSRSAASRTPSRPIDAQLVRHCVRGAGVLSVFPLATPLPSTASVELPLLFGGFFGNMGVSDFSSASMAGLQPLAFPAPPAPCGAGTDETSQLLCRKLPGVHRVSDRAGSLQDWRLTPCNILPSASLNSVGIPDSGFRGSIPGLPVSPVNASAAPSRAPLHDSGPE